MSLRVFAGTPYLVKDINTTVGDGDDPYGYGSGSRPNEFTELHGRVFFNAYVGQAGWQIWSTDGTAAGTRVVAPEQHDTSGHLVRAGDQIIVFAHGVFTSSIWRLDGTPHGMTQISSTLFNCPCVPKGNQVFFFYGGAVMVTDGTTAGTQPYARFAINDQQTITDLTLLGDHVMFSTARGLYTVASDVIARIFAADQVSDLSVAGGKLYFWAVEGDGLEPFVSDGTRLGTTLLRDIRPGDAGSRPASGSKFVEAGDRAVFVAEDGDGAALWATDGTETGTQRIAPLPHDTTTSFGPMIGRTRYFVTGTTLWQTDGTAAGTHAVTAMAQTRVDEAAAANGVLYVRSDKTLFRLDPGTGIAALVVANNGATLKTAKLEVGGLDDRRIILSAGEVSFDPEPWVTDGTMSGTSVIAELVPANGTSSSPLPLAPYGDSLVFEAWPFGRAEGGKLYVTDGTADTTRAVGDATLRNDISLTKTLTFGGAAYIIDNSKLISVTPDGLRAINDMPEIRDAVAADDAIYTSGSFGPARFDGKHVTRLGRSNATFVSCVGLALGLFDSDLVRFDDGARSTVRTFHDPLTLGTCAGGLAYLVTEDAAKHAQLWRSDGTVDGTTLVTDLGTNDVTRLTPGETRVFIAGSAGLFVSDGTAGGTHVVPVAATGKPAQPCGALGDRLLFLLGSDLWITDGREEGTTFLAKLPSEVALDGADIRAFTAAAGAAYLQVRTDSSGAALWQTDGTAAGTHRVGDLTLYEYGPPLAMLAAGNRLYFAADDHSSGFELWALPFDQAVDAGPDLRVTPGATAHFHVTLTQPASRRIDIAYATRDVTAAAGSDYTPASGTLTFEPGETSKEVDVQTVRRALVTTPIFRLELRDTAGLPAGRMSATAIINALPTYDLSVEARDFVNGKPSFVVRNSGPATAPTVTVTTATPYGSGAATTLTNVAAGAVIPISPAIEFASSGIWVVELSSPYDANPANDTFVGRYARTGSTLFSYAPADLRPGGNVKLIVSSPALTTGAIATSSNPSVVAIGTPTFSSAQLSIPLTALMPGTSTISVSGIPGTIDVTVLPSGEFVRFPADPFIFTPEPQTSIAGHLTEAHLELYTPLNVDLPFAPTGTVTLSDEGQVTATITIGPGKARSVPLASAPFTFDPGRASDHMITLSYSGDAHFDARSYTLPWHVLQAPADMRLLATPQPDGATDLTIVATGTPRATPTGVVRVSDDRGELPPTEVTLAQSVPGTATARLRLHLSFARHTFTILYLGDSTYLNHTYTLPLTVRRQSAGR